MPVKALRASLVVLLMFVIYAAAAKADCEYCSKDYFLGVPLAGPGDCKPALPGDPGGSTGCKIKSDWNPVEGSTFSCAEEGNACAPLDGPPPPDFINDHGCADFMTYEWGCIPPLY